MARLTRQQGIEGATRAKKRFTTKSDPAHVRAPDLVNRDFTAPAPDRRWVADITYIRTRSGLVYAAFLWNAPPSQSTESMFGGNLRW